MILLAGGAAAAFAIPQRTPRCFGAAARDPRHPCQNPRLRRSVQPRPSVALITPNLPCAVTEEVGPGTTYNGALSVCAFGTPSARAVGSVALIGDSHAMNWE